MPDKDLWATTPSKRNRSSGNLWKPTRATTPKTSGGILAAKGAFDRSRSQPHQGFWGQLGEPFHNAGKAILGIGPGVYETGKAAVGSVKRHPLSAAYPHSFIASIIADEKDPLHKLGKEVALSYKYKYGSGDWKTTLRRAFMEDPVGTILDIASVATLGEAGAAKVGALGKAPREVTLRSPGARVGQEAKTVVRPVTGSGLSRRLKAGAQEALNRLPAEFPVVGETHRYGKQLVRSEDRNMLREQVKAGPHAKAWARLSDRERIAANLMHDYPSRRLLTEFRDTLPAGSPMRVMLDDPKMLRFFDSPTKKMQMFLAESKKLAEENVRVGEIHPDAAAQRQYLHALLLRGAKFDVDQNALTNMLASDRVAPLKKRIIKSILESPPGDDLARGRWVHAADRDNYGRVVSIGGDTAQVHFISPEGFEKTVDLPIGDLTPIPSAKVARSFGLPVEMTGPKPIPEMIADIQAELRAEGRPLPQYRKDVMVEEKGTGVGAGGAAAQSKRSPGNRQNTGHLASTAQVNYTVDGLTPAFLKNVKWATYKDRHQDLLDSGVHVTEEYRLKKGEEYVKRVRGEKIPFTEQKAGEFERSILEGLDKDLVTLDRNEAFITPEGKRVVIPTKLREQVVGEWTKSNKAVEWFFKKPTTVWRALVLNLRVGWLVNNIVGNTLLYTVKQSGPGGLRAYLGAIADTQGIRKALHLVDDPQITSRLTPADMAEILPDQVAGTFFGTQTPAAGKFGRSKPGRALTALPRVLRHVDIGYEQALRRAVANRVLRRSPEARTLYGLMPKQTRSWRAAMKQAAHDPAVVERTAREIESTLGNFRGLSHLEQTVLRQAAPFYAWYRAITVVMAKMPLDSPIRSNVLYNLGKIGDAHDAEGYPYGGAIDLGGGAIFRTAGMNPYGTVPQVGGDLRTMAQGFVGPIPHSGITPVDPYRRAFAMGMFNPFISALFARDLYNTGRYLPETRLAYPPNSKMYSDAGHMAELFNYLGVPYRHLRGERPQP